MPVKTYQPMSFDASPSRGWGTGSFTVPADVGEYAPETMYLERTPFAQEAVGYVNLAIVSELQLMIAALPAGAVVEVDLIRPGDSPSGTWRIAVKSYTTVGLTATVPLSRWPGVRVRVKSGGTGGTAVADVTWWG